MECAGEGHVESNVHDRKEQEHAGGEAAGTEELELVERLAEQAGTSRSDAIRQALRRGAREELLRRALQAYRDDEVGMRGAAEIAGVSIAEMMAEANDRGVLTNYDEADLADDVDVLR